MFTFLGTILSLKWISEHLTGIIVVAVGIVAIIILAIRNKRKAEQQAIAARRMEAEKDKARQAELRRIEQERATNSLKDKTAIVNSAPDEIDGKIIMYQYKDVVVISEGKPETAKAGDSLDLKIGDNHVYVKDNGVLIGRMYENRLSDMVRDWKNANDPVLAYYVKPTPEGQMITLSFYGDVIGKFLAKNPEAKLVKLTGKQDDFATYSKGMECTAEQDIETEKYTVLCDGDMIGCLPASAIAYAEKHSIEPEDLYIIIADIDYDLEKQRDIISVYIAE